MDRLNKRGWIDSRHHWRSTLYVLFSVSTQFIRKQSGSKLQFLRFFCIFVFFYHEQLFGHLFYAFDWKKELLKINLPKSCFIESLCHTAFLKNLNFWAHWAMIKKKYQLNRNEKFLDKAQQCFVFLHIKPKFKFAVQWSWFLET